MEKYKHELISRLSKVDQSHVRLAVIILALSLFVLGAGAPGAFGDFTH